MTTAALLINLALSTFITAFVGGTAFLVASRLDRGISPHAASGTGRSRQPQLASVEFEEGKAA